MVRDRMEKMWAVMGQVSKTESQAHTAQLSVPQLLFWPSVKLNSFSFVGQYKVLILLALPFGPQCPYLSETLYGNRDYRHLRSYTYTRARRAVAVVGRGSVGLPVRLEGALEGVRSSMVNIRRRAGKGDNGGAGRPVRRGTGRLIDRRISGRVEDGHVEEGGYGSFLGPRRVRVDWWRARASFGGFSEVKAGFC
jgi:hypothetical protein